MAENDHVLDNFGSEDMENISLPMYSFVRSLITGYYILYIIIAFIVHLVFIAKSSYTTRNLLSTSQWETCDFETNYLRNESDPDHKSTTPNEAYGWMILHILCVIVIFIGIQLNYKTYSI